MTSLQWNEIATAPEGVPVNTITDTGLEQVLIRENGLWWLQDRSMYIYYQPKFWKPLE